MATVREGGCELGFELVVDSHAFISFGEDAIRSPSKVTSAILQTIWVSDDLVLVSLAIRNVSSSLEVLR